MDESATKKKVTTLQKGDKIFWYKSNRTISFARGADRLYAEGGDDKFFFPIDCHMQFNTLVDIISEVTGLQGRLLSSEADLVIYIFE